MAYQLEHSDTTTHKSPWEESKTRSLNKTNNRHGRTSDSKRPWQPASAEKDGAAQRADPGEAYFLGETKRCWLSLKGCDSQKGAGLCGAG